MSRLRRVQWVQQGRVWQLARATTNSFNFWMDVKEKSVIEILISDLNCCTPCGDLLRSTAAVSRRTKIYSMRGGGGGGGGGGEGAGERECEAREERDLGKKNACAWKQTLAGRSAAGPLAWTGTCIWEKQAAKRGQGHGHSGQKCSGNM